MRRVHPVRRALLIALVIVAAFGLAAQRVGALEVELDDVAPDRIERQRAYTRGEVLPGTPDVDQLDRRLAAKGLAPGNPIYIRIFKETSELELWMLKGASYVLLDTYPVCNWTGTLGPKLKEGDKQSPEGFYSITMRQTRLVGRWRKAFNIGFPNHYDQINRRSGSFILVHGGCSSVGCFAMTERVQQEIYGLAMAAMRGGQKRFHVHIFPFRMTEERMAAAAGAPWIGFWRDLKEGYDSFERMRVPPRVGICGKRYFVSDGEPGWGGDTKPLALLPMTVKASLDSDAQCGSVRVRMARQDVGEGAVDLGKDATTDLVTGSVTGGEPAKTGPASAEEAKAPSRDSMRPERRRVSRRSAIARELDVEDDGPPARRAGADRAARPAVRSSRRTEERKGPSSIITPPSGFGNALRRGGGPSPATTGG